MTDLPPELEAAVPDVARAMRESQGKLLPQIYYLDDARAAILALLPHLPRWQTMENAPKTPDDLTETRSFLGWCPDDEAPDGGDVRVVWWEPHMEGGRWFGDRDLFEFPTAWMPTPTPPKEPDHEW